MPRTWSLIALLLVACGGGKPAWVERQRALLEDDDVVGTRAGPGATNPGAKSPTRAPPLSANDATQTHCAGFMPDGSAALVLREERLMGGAQHQITVTAEVVGTPSAAGLKRVTLAAFDPDQSEDALLGDGLERLVAEHLPAVNEQIEAAGLLRCEPAIETDSGDGFQRKTRHLMAWPKGHATRISVRDGGLYVAPEGAPARRVRPIAEGAGLSLTRAWYLSTQGHLVVVLRADDRDRVHNELVFVPNVVP